jgi:hypothetical protein
MDFVALYILHLLSGRNHHTHTLPWLYYASPSSCIRRWMAARASRKGRSR